MTMTVATIAAKMVTENPLSNFIVDGLKYLNKILFF
jgi:hypothetical protein